MEDKKVSRSPYYSLRILETSKRRTRGKKHWQCIFGSYSRYLNAQKDSRFRRSDFNLNDQLQETRRTSDVDEDFLFTIMENKANISMDEIANKSLLNRYIICLSPLEETWVREKQAEFSNSKTCHFLRRHRKTICCKTDIAKT